MSGPVHVLLLVFSEAFFSHDICLANSRDQQWPVRPSTISGEQSEA
jgi:hypothetical protein